MPSGRSLLAPILVAVTALGAVACGAEPESLGREEPTETSDMVDDSIDAPDAGSGDDRAVGSDARLAQPAAGRVEVAIDREGDHTALFVGDSVLVSVADDLAARVDGDLVFDAVDCRRLAETVHGSCGGVPSGAEITDGVASIANALLDLRLEGVVPDVAIIVLANNSTMEPEFLDVAMELLGDVPQVWWVNARIDGFGRQDLNNDALDDLARRVSNADVIDWYGESHDADWFRDHVHPNDLGQRRLAQLIDEHLACGCVP